MSNRYVAIMAGGIGSRFWPKSRTNYPKQFLDILNTGKTLIQSTFHRYNKIVPAENIFVVTSDEYTDIVAEQLPDLPQENIVAEPFRKNTAPCIAYIAFKIFKKDPDAIMIAAPSDNLILEDDAFGETAENALQFVESVNALVTLGIKPRTPNTGYGYIQHDTMEAAPGIYKVKTFTEKPNLELAKVFVKSGDFLWNSGIFTWKVKTFWLHLKNFFRKCTRFLLQKLKNLIRRRKKNNRRDLFAMSEYFHRFWHYGKSAECLCDPCFLYLERSGHLEQCV